MKDFIKTLVEYGLSDKEAKIYVALLELELATVSEIAKQSGINRSSTYVVLEMLKKKGLTGVSNDKKTRRYVAASPDILLRSAREVADKQSNIKKKVESIVPELKALYKGTKHKPVLKMFEGKEATEYAYKDISLLKTSPDVKEIRVYENPEGYIDVLPPGWIELDYKERMRLGLHMCSIYPNTKEANEVERRYRALGSKDELIEIPEEKFSSSQKFANLTITGDEVWFSSLRDNYCINIKKQEIANILSHIFDLAKEEAKRLHEELNLKGQYSSKLKTRKRGK